MALYRLAGLRDDIQYHGDGRIVARMPSGNSIIEQSSNSIIVAASKYYYIIILDDTCDHTSLTWYSSEVLMNVFISCWKYTSLNVSLFVIIVFRRWVRIRQGELSYYKPDDDNQQALNILQLSDDVTIIKKLNFNSFSIETRKKVY